MADVLPAASPSPPPERGARIAHIGIAVASLAEAAAFYRDVLLLDDVDLAGSDKAVIQGFKAGESLVELLEPETPDSPIGKFIAKRGPGIHHICFAVDDITAVLDRCRAAGVRLIDNEPRTGALGQRIAFIHPSSTNGILVELQENESGEP